MLFGKMVARRCAVLLLLCGLYLNAGYVKHVDAHPHAWIDVSVEIVFDKEHRMVALRETWLFDFGYTAYALATAGAKNLEDVEQTYLDQLATENLKQLKAYDYFTVVRKDQSLVTTTLMQETTVRLRDNRIEMRFTLSLAEPIYVARHHVTYTIFDPAYYVEMLHEEREGAIVLVGGAPECRYTLSAPNPSFEAVALAAALDQAATAEEGFGALFSERVRIRCD